MKESQSFHLHFGLDTLPTSPDIGIGSSTNYHTFCNMDTNYEPGLQITRLLSHGYKLRDFWRYPLGSHKSPHQREREEHTKMSGDWCNEEDGNLPSRFEGSKSLLRDGLFDSTDALDGAIESYAYLREFGVKVGITSLNEKGETIRISGGTVRIYYCDSCVDTSGHVCPWNCTFQIRASKKFQRVKRLPTCQFHPKKIITIRRRCISRARRLDFLNKNYRRERPFNKSENSALRPHAGTNLSRRCHYSSGPRREQPVISNRSGSMRYREH